MYHNLLSLLTSLLLLCSIAQAETFSTFYSKDASSEAVSLALQQATTSRRTVELIDGQAYCEVACTITLYRNSGVISATPHGYAVLDSGSPYAQPFSDSGATGGLVLAKYHLTAGQTVAVDLSNIKLQPRTTQNVVLSSNAVTGEVDLLLIWRGK